MDNKFAQQEEFFVAFFVAIVIFLDDTLTCLYACGLTFWARIAN